MQEKVRVLKALVLNLMAVDRGEGNGGGPLHVIVVYPADLAVKQRRGPG